jgi:hypothetical protein
LVLEKDAVFNPRKQVGKMKENEWIILEAVHYLNYIFPSSFTIFYKGVKISRLEFENMKTKLGKL